MTLEVVRRIRDNVHGSIDVTALEDAIIAHPAVQRLRRLRQLAFLNYVFPGASHSRFEHSLGVMHLAGSTWDKLGLNQARLARSAGRIDEFARIEGTPVGSSPLIHGLLQPTFASIRGIFESDTIRQALRIAGLAHDLGHPPFSHSGECFLPTWQAVLESNVDIPEFLQAYLRAKIDGLLQVGRDPNIERVPHEILTLLILDGVLREVQKDSSLNPRIDPQDVASILDPKIPPVEGSEIHRAGVSHLCHELISGELDVDRMDYLLRDSRECGVVYGLFDSHRILDCLTFYHSPEDGRMHVAIRLSGLAAFEDYLRARNSMYLQVYFHKTAVAADAMIRHLARHLEGWTLPASTREFLEIDDSNMEGLLLRTARNLADPKESLEFFHRLVRNLIRDRQLWKRVYEVASTSRAPASAKTLEQVRTILSRSGYRTEEISTTGSLTRFRKREVDQPSRNYLRLIKSDERQVPRVVPIEDYSQLISENVVREIRRFYVEVEPNCSGTEISRSIREGLSDP